jgi:tetratricopeptide (TPR) repeat protein
MLAKRSRNMRTRLLIALLLAAAPSIAFAQRGGVGGRVVDDEGKPVGDVEIVIQPESDIDRPRTIKTKGDGTFLMMGLSPGRYTLSYTKEGHEKASQLVQVEIGARNRLGDVVLPRLPADYVDPGAQEYFDAGVAASRDGNFQKAVEAFAKVNEMAPDRPEVLYNLGFAYEGLEQMDAAVEQYERALELRPEYYDPLIALAAIHTARKEWSEAANRYERAIALRPQEIAVLYNYGAVSMNAGDMEKAVSAFEKVLAIEPDRGEAHYQLGMIAVSQQRNEDALRHLEKYLELEPEGPYAATAKGIVDTLAKQP